MMGKKKNNSEKSIPTKKEKKAYSSEELLRLGKEKNNMDFVRVEKKK